MLAWPRWAAAGQAGVERAGQGLGPRGGELGRPDEREREEEADRAGLGSGPQGRKKGLRAGVVFGSWAGLGLGFGFSLTFSISIPK